MSPIDPSLLDLVRLCGDSASARAWELLVQRLQPVIACAIWRALTRAGAGLSPNRDMVDDLVQQTFVRLCDSDRRALKNSTFQTEAGFVAYVRTIAANLTIDFLRQSKKSPVLLDENIPDRTPPGGETAMLLAAIEKHLSLCSENNLHRDRKVFWLYYKVGLTARDIAAIQSFELTQKGVESLISRLIRCIRKYLVADRVEGISSSFSSSEKGRALGAAT